MKKNAISKNSFFDNSSLKEIFESGFGELYEFPFIFPSLSVSHAIHQLFFHIFF